MTLHRTRVSVVPVTAEAKVCGLPSRTDAVAGVTVTRMEDGVGVGTGGFGTTELAIPPPQPAAHAAAASSANNSPAEDGCTVAQESVTAFSERGRMLSEMQAKCQPEQRGPSEQAVRGFHRGNTVSCSHSES